MSKKALAARRKEFLSLMDEHGFLPRNDDQGKTVKAFASRVGFDYGTVRQWRCGSRTPSRHSMRIIKLLLNQSPAT